VPPIHATLLPLVLVTVLAGCASDRVADSGGPSVLVRFPPTGAADIIQVTVTDRQPVRTAELVGPAGSVPAYSINTEAPRYGGSGGGFFPSIGLGIGGGSGGVGGGVGIGFPLGALGGGSPSPDPTTVSNAYIKVPDRGEYARDLQSRRIRVEIGWPPEGRTIELPAPQPPA